MGYWFKPESLTEAIKEIASSDTALAKALAEELLLEQELLAEDNKSEDAPLVNCPQEDDE